jgi:hypothetical protein
MEGACLMSTSKLHLLFRLTRLNPRHSISLGTFFMSTASLLHISLLFGNHSVLCSERAIYSHRFAALENPR